MKKNKLNKKSLGFSLVESLVAISLLGGVLVLFTFFSSSRQNQIQTGHYKSCLQTTQDVIDKIKSVGIVKSVNQLDETNNRLVRPSNNAEDNLNFISIADDWLAVNSNFWNRSGPNTIFKNHKALIGSMSLLNSLYNKDSRFCAEPEGLEFDNSGNAELTENKDVEYLKGVNTKIRIQTINLNTANLSCPARPITIRPGGLKLNNTQAQELLETILPEPGSRADLGFFITVTTSYNDTNNNQQKCSSSAVFNYPKIPPNDVNKTGLITSSLTQGSVNACDTSISATARIIVSPQLKNEKAITLVCRDASRYPHPAAPPSFCVGGSTEAPFSTNDKWVNCLDVTLCGRAPNNRASAESNPGLGAGNDGYLLQYSGLSLGCNMAIEVRALDAAHNVTLNAHLLRSIRHGRTNCQACGFGYNNRPPSIGWCPGGGRTMANSCNPVPQPPTDGDGDGGGDGGDGGGHHDGSDGDDGTN
jgi:type II secretory pathway pseudopilin PulG